MATVSRTSHNKLPPGVNCISTTIEYSILIFTNMVYIGNARNTKFARRYVFGKLATCISQHTVNKFELRVRKLEKVLQFYTRNKHRCRMINCKHCTYFIAGCKRSNATILVNVRLELENNHCKWEVQKNLPYRLHNFTPNT